MSVYHLCYCLHLYYCCYAKTSSPAVQKRHSKVYGNPIAPSLYSILLTNNHVLPPKGGHQRLKAIVSIFNYVLHGKGKFQNSYVSLLIFLCSIYLTLLKFTATWLFKFGNQYTFIILFIFLFREYTLSLVKICVIAWSLNARDVIFRAQSKFIVLKSAE